MEREEIDTREGRSAAIGAAQREIVRILQRLENSIGGKVVTLHIATLEVTTLGSLPKRKFLQTVYIGTSVPLDDEYRWS